MMIVQHKVSVLASRTRHSSQRKGGLLGCARQYNGKVYMQCYDAGTAERTHTHTHAHADTHARTWALCGETWRRSPLIPREESVAAVPGGPVRVLLRCDR